MLSAFRAGRVGEQVAVKGLWVLAAIGPHAAAVLPKVDEVIRDAKSEWVIREAKQARSRIAR